MGSKSNIVESIKEAVSSATRAVSENPEIEINTSELSIDESVQKVLDYVLPIIKNK